MALSRAPRRPVQQLVNHECARASRRRIHHAPARPPRPSSASSSSSSRTFFDEERTCVLLGLPASFLPEDVRRYVASTLLLSDPTSLEKVISVPDVATAWTQQTNMLVFSSASGVQEVRERLGNGRREGWMIGGSRVEMEETRKHGTGRTYVAALAHQAREACRIRAQGAGPAHGEVVMPERSGRAVLLAGLPRNSRPLQLENTLINLGFPLQRAADLSPLHRLSNALYWPLIDPSPSCALLSNDFSLDKSLVVLIFHFLHSCLTHRLHHPHKPQTNRNKTPATTRFQVLYTPSVIISDYIVGELNHSVPTWLGTRLDSRSSPDHLQSPGWKLLAKVVY